MRLEVYNRENRFQRLICTVCALSFLLVSCTKETARDVAPAHDPTIEPWYRTSTNELVALNRNASEAYAQGKTDAASQMILQAEPVSARLLAVTKPTLAAVMAASDLDALYGKMLFKNRHYGWARLQFQKNLARWKHWKPQTPETELNLQAAQDGINDCDKKLEAPFR